MSIPKSFLPILLAAIAGSLLAGCETEGTGSTTESGVVSGRILTKGNLPVAGVSVSLVPVNHVPSPAFRKAAAVEALTDAGGNYRIPGVPAGTYALIAAKDTLAAFRDSLAVPAAGLDAGADTLLRSGSLEGTISLTAGEDARTVLILVLGTNLLTVPRDHAGGFRLENMAEGKYRVRFLSTLKDYRPLDTVLAIRAGARDTLAGPVRLPFTGIPKVVGLQAVWDASTLAVNLTWSAVDTAGVSGYYVYRAATGAPFGTLPLNPDPIVKPAFRDTSVEVGKSYAYAVKALDKNGNAGPTFSAVASVATAGEYTLARSIEPEGYSLDVTPLAVSGGEIFWLQPDRIDVYDTAGALRRTFGADGPDPIGYGVSIRVFGDTVYVIDALGPPGTRPKEGGGSRIRKFTKSGQAAGGIDLDADFTDIGPAGAADLCVGPDGTLFATNGVMIYALRPGGGMDSIESPLEPDFRNLFAELEPVGGKMLLMGSYREFPGDIRRTQSVLIGTDLSAGSLAKADYFLNAYAGDSEGNTWIVKDDSLVQEFGADQTLRRRIRLPEALYRDIQVEAGVVYLYDYSASAIRVYRRP
jgi:hypothetical protein